MIKCNRRLSLLILILVFLLFWAWFTDKPGPGYPHGEFGPLVLFLALVLSAVWFMGTIFRQLRRSFPQTFPNEASTKAGSPPTGDNNSMIWNRKSALVLAFLVGGAILLAVSALKRPPGGITRENHDKIKTWMTLQDVQAIVGVPEGDYRSTDRVVYYSWYRDKGGHFWTTDKGQIVIWVDANGRVENKAFSVPANVLPSLPEKFLEAITLQTKIRE